MNYQIIIDGRPFSYKNQFISGEQIRKLGNVPKTNKIWFKVNKSDYKLEINNRDTVDLNRQGAEEFFSSIQ
jgi:hypothetical protein